VRFPPSRAAPGLVLLLVVAGCGGATQGAPDGGTGSDSGGADGGSTPVCPAASPGQGGACGPQGLTCEWGSSPLLECDVVGTCNGGRWEVTTVGPGECGPPPTGTCPSSFAAVPRGTHCSPDGLECTYPEGLCACAPTGGPPVVDASAITAWACQDPAPGCPQPRPRLGTPCSQDGQQCDYGACTIPGGTAEACQGGLWVESAVHCPPVP
jgi:hypothetical protein